MKKKNIFTIAIALLLVAVVAVGATLAYFTSKDQVTNTFTMGNVKIDLQEKTSADTAWGDGPLSFEKLMPLDTADKMAQVVVDADSADCYVRVTIKLTDVTPFDATTGLGLKDADTDALYAAVETAIGNKSGDWTVTEAKNTAGTITGLICDFDTTTPCSANDVLALFDEIAMPDFGNNAQGQSFGLELNAYAVQSANVTIATFDWDTAFGVTMP